MSKTAAPASTAGQIPAQPGPPSLRWQARRRRPGVLALAAALIAAGAVGNYWYWTQNGQRTPVLVMARDVSAGTVIQDADLAEASVALDPALKAIGTGQRAQVVGKRAAVELLPGALLAPGQVTSRTLVRQDEQLVGLNLKPGQLPDSPLKPEDQVQVVFTGDSGATAAGKNGKPGQDSGPVTVEARIVRVGTKQDSTGQQVIDVAVKSAGGPRLAAQAAAGNVALAVKAASGAGS
ncbi:MULTISPECIES: SAF domain-containing protein [unclassified Streptomyces]|uniref:SAF domain-containing protein n=1 Tax=unclassified Streptomyces TaxID=2593676 RepID=UPI0037F538F6